MKVLSVFNSITSSFINLINLFILNFDLPRNIVLCMLHLQSERNKWGKYRTKYAYLWFS